MNGSTACLLMREFAAGVARIFLLFEPLVIIKSSAIINKLEDKMVIKPSFDKDNI